MHFSFNNFLTSILTAGILSLCGIAWSTYNQFVRVVVQIDFLINSLDTVTQNEKQIFIRLSNAENKILILETKDLKEKTR